MFVSIPHKMFKLSHMSLHLQASHRSSCVRWTVMCLAWERCTTVASNCSRSWQLWTSLMMRSRSGSASAGNPAGFSCILTCMLVVSSCAQLVCVLQSMHKPHRARGTALTTNCFLQAMCANLSTGNTVSWTFRCGGRVLAAGPEDGA